MKATENAGNNLKKATQRLAGEGAGGILTFAAFSHGCNRAKVAVNALNPAITGTNTKKNPCSFQWYKYQRIFLNIQGVNGETQLSEEHR